MSESDLSLPDDESSFHPSDYSESSIDDRPVASRRDKQHTNQSTIQTFQPEVTPRLKPTERGNRKAQNCVSTDVSASGSSGSPWVDDTGSSSSTSSDTSKSRILLSINEQIRFDEARERLRQAQKRPRSPQKSRVHSFDSSASVRTGKHPSKPIDVTDTHDVMKVSPILDKIRYMRHRHDDSTGSGSMKSREIIKIRNDTPKSRIVGILPSIIEGQGLNVYDRNRNSERTNRPVPPIVVPEFCSPVDDISSLGFTVSHSNKRSQRMSRNRLTSGENNDLELGNIVNKHENESSTTIGWIEQRTNLELCLLFSVATSGVALLALLTIIFAR